MPQQIKFEDLGVYGRNKEPIQLFIMNTSEEQLFGLEEWSCG